eukprot:1157759-Pelagomonas_calceolata.AAC.4
MPYADGVPLFLPVVCKHDPGQPEGHACDHSIRRRCSGGEGHEAAAAMHPSSCAAHPPGNRMRLAAHGSCCTWIHAS